MVVPTIRVGKTADFDAVINTIVSGFTDDPMCNWHWPTPRQYQAGMTGFVELFAEQAFSYGTVYCSTDVCGAALWLPPGMTPKESALANVFMRTTSETICQQVFQVFDKLLDFHPQDPHWYLALVGVDPAYQGRGIGTALMNYGLARCDQDHLPAYLQSTNPRNISLYQRHGFDVLGQAQAGTSPPVIAMLRTAR